MAVAKTVQAQRDFSAGEIDPAAKRSDQAQDTTSVLRSGMRQASNVRILNTKGLQVRPGREAFQNANNRLDEITIRPGVVFRFNFSASNGGSLLIFNTNSAIVLFANSLGWTALTIPLINWAVMGDTVYIAPAVGQPLFTTWNGVSWTTPAAFAPQVTTGGQVRTFFYRLSPRSVTMQPSATTGAITMAFSPAVASFNATMVGSLLRFCGRQIRVTGFTSTALLSGTVLETLPPGETLTVTPDPRTLFTLGDEAIGQSSNARGLVTALSATQITVQLLQASAGATPGFTATEIVTGPGGSVTNSAVTITAPQAVAVWDDEVMNNFRGWPTSVFSDQSRLGFCNFPGLPNAIGWSAISAPGDCYVEALPSSAMLELAPDKVQVYFVVPGAESSEFVFCDKRIYYIPITPSNPLKPGSVAFQTLSGDGAAAGVQPRAVQEVILYLNAGLTSIMSIVAVGATNRPYETRNISEMHAHLIKTPIAIAVPGASNEFEERYIYVLNRDGTLAVGKYSIASGQIAGTVGWVPWSGVGTITWASAHDATVLFVTDYGFGRSVLEQVTNRLYLDASILVNSPPPGLATPPIPGLGPLWWIANQSIDLMDQDTRAMGTYQIDINGFLVPQFRAGEDLASPTLRAGKAWTSTMEPFVPAAQPGQDNLQRMRKRRLPRMQVYVKNSTGFRVDVLNAEQQGRYLPAIGDVLTSRRIPAWNQDDNPLLPPPQREQAYPFKPLGRAHDPRVAIVKDTPGPLQLLEIGFEATV